MIRAQGLTALPRKALRGRAVVVQCHTIKAIPHKRATHIETIAAYTKHKTLSGISPKQK